MELPRREDIPREPRVERWQQVFSEMKRINNYRASGDVATEGQLAYYVDWLKGLTKTTQIC